MASKYELVDTISTHESVRFFESDSDSIQSKGSRRTLGDLMIAASFLVAPNTALANESESMDGGVSMIQVDSATAASIGSWRRPSVAKVSNDTRLPSYFSTSLGDETGRWNKLSDTLDKWSMLSDGWGGLHSKAPSAIGLRNAKRLRAMLISRGLTPPEVYIDADGEVGFRWRNGDHVSAIAFTDEGAIEAYIDDRAKNELREIESSDLATFPLDEFLISAA